MTTISLLSETDFYTAIAHYASQKGLGQIQDPTIGQTRLSLYRLYLYVNEAGGFHRVTCDHAWKRIADRFSFPPSYNTASQLKQIYSKFILDLERTQRPNRGPALSLTFTRIIRSFDSAFPNEIQWALTELSQLTPRQQWPSDAFRALLEMISRSLHSRQESFPWAIQQGISHLWNACATWSPAPLLAVPSAFDCFVRASCHKFDLLLSLKVAMVFLNLLELILREEESQIDPEACELSASIPRLLSSEDRAFRIQGLGICSALCRHHPGWIFANVQWLLEAALLNLHVPDDQLQTSATDFLFYLTDVLEQHPEQCTNIDISSTIRALFHVIFDGITLRGRGHVRNIPFLSILKSSSNASQLASKWLLLCFVPKCEKKEISNSQSQNYNYESHSHTDSIKQSHNQSNIDINQSDNPTNIKESHDNPFANGITLESIYKEFIAFSHRLFPNFPELGIVEFCRVLSCTFKFPPSSSCSFTDQHRHLIPLEPRNWLDRPIKTTEKVVTSILTLRNLSLLPSELIRGFEEHFDDVCRLATLKDNQFVARHFSVILEELFAGGL